MVDDVRLGSVWLAGVRVDGFRVTGFQLADLPTIHFPNEYTEKSAGDKGWVEVEMRLVSW